MGFYTSKINWQKIASENYNYNYLLPLSDLDLSQLNSYYERVKFITKQEQEALFLTFLVFKIYNRNYLSKDIDYSKN